MNIVIKNILKRLLNGLIFLLFFLGPGILYLFIAKRIYWKRLKEYGKNKGYRHVLSPSYDDFGELHGEYRRYSVRIRICHDNPSSGPWIAVSLKPDVEILDLRTYRPMRRPFEGWEDFVSPSFAFNMMYGTRRIKSAYKKKLLDSPWLFNEIVDFYDRWMFHLSNDIGTNGFDTDGSELRCTFGPSMVRSMFPYIVPEKIDKILPDMVSLAEKIDSVFG